MSRFTGKCDLYDHMMMEKMYPLYPNNEHSPLTSDELECFEIFKKKTGGILYQRKRIMLDEWSAKNEAKYNPFLKIIEHKETVKDARCKSGTKEKTTYTYKLHGFEFKTLDELNKMGYYGDFIIRFEDIFDLIPYYPYIIVSCACSEDKETIFISEQSYVDEHEHSRREHGIDVELDYFYHDRHMLQQHYLEIMERMKDGSN